MLGRLASRSARTSQHTCWPPRTSLHTAHQSSDRPCSARTSSHGSGHLSKSASLASHQPAQQLPSATSAALSAAMRQHRLGSSQLPSQPSTHGPAQPLGRALAHAAQHRTQPTWLRSPSPELWSLPDLLEKRELIKDPEIPGASKPSHWGDVPNDYQAIPSPLRDIPNPFSYKPNPFATRKTSLGSFARGEETLTLVVRKPEPWLREVGVAERRPVRTSRDVRSGRSSRPRHRRVLYFPPPPLDYGVFMQGLVQAMQTQAHTQATLQAQLEARE
ncbi:hypothetical protein Taro_023922 [Colocasia esculenta]|uniref:Uncharacterized protein n=1 Tax=Colocasia esculenta TaxID=4460 RepID=A0A843V5F5_COLES|nr:hypothetical protein [Colocasia esculenta]